MRRYNSQDKVVLAAADPEYMGKSAIVLDFEEHDGIGTMYLIMFGDGVMGTVGECFLKPDENDTQLTQVQNAASIKIAIYHANLQKEALEKANREAEEAALDDTANWANIIETTGWNPFNPRTTEGAEAALEEAALDETASWGNIIKTTGWNPFNEKT